MEIRETTPPGVGLRHDFTTGVAASSARSPTGPAGGISSSLLDGEASEHRPDRDASLGQGGERPEDPPQHLGWGVLLDHRHGRGVDGPKQQPEEPRWHQDPQGEGSWRGSRR
jgi:hypothetical protein